MFEMKIKDTGISRDAQDINKTLVYPIKSIKVDSNAEVWQRNEIQEAGFFFFCNASRSVDNEAALISYLTYISKMDSSSHIATVGRS